jgi:hypothetical protein
LAKQIWGSSFGMVGVVVRIVYLDDKVYLRRVMVLGLNILPKLSHRSLLIFSFKV